MDQTITRTCERVFALALTVLQEEAVRIQGVEGDTEARPGLAGRSERHFQAVLFEGLHRAGLRVTVEDAYFGFEERRTNVPTADLAVQIDGGRWLWVEIKRVRPAELGFATLNVVNADAQKLDEVAQVDPRNLPQALIFVLIRALDSREYSASWYWDSINRQSAVSRWSFSRHQVVEIPLSGARRAEMMVAMWARDDRSQGAGVPRRVHGGS